MKKRVKIHYDNVNKADFNRDYGKFLDKINSYLKHALGSKEDGLTDSLKAYIECAEVVGHGKWIELYIYGWKEDYSEDELSKSELHKLMVNSTKAIERLVGDYLDAMPTTFWNAKIEIKGKKTEVGPYILYRWDEEKMDKVIGESRVVIESGINEGISFAKYYGFALSRDLGDVKAGELFYCSDVDKNTVTFTKQSDKSYTIKLPTSFAKLVFRDASLLERGKTYTLKIDIPYTPLEYVGDMEWKEEFVNKYTKKFKGESWIVFPKGTKFKYVGEDMSGDYFIVDGEEIPMSDVTMLGYEIGKDIKGYNDIFKM